MPDKNKWKLFWPPLWWQYMRSNSDFLLRIGPLSKHQRNKTSNSYYSPPGYGIPPGSTQQEHCFCPEHRYGLFLFPGKIVFWFFLFSITLPFFIFTPLFSSYTEDPYKFFIYTSYICSFWLFSYGFYRALYNRWMLPVLSTAWEKWPTPAYHLFLSVPHHVSIKETWENKDEYLYWHPDTQGDMYRQTTEFAPNTQSLQEVILNFAVFECFFQRPDKKVDAIEKLSKNETDKKRTIDTDNYEKAINEKNWYLYLFSPVWLNYGLILLYLMILTYHPIIDLPDNTINIIKASSDQVQVQVPAQKHWHPITFLPYSFIPVILIWFVLSFLYTQRILSGLEELHKKVRQGTFNTHLDLVPQQILKQLANIPSPEQVSAGIQHIKKLMSLISGIAVIGFLAILEVLSQAYGSSPTTFLTF